MRLPLKMLRRISVMKLVGIFAVVILAACAQPQAVQWEHGWKTKRVIATRYAGKAMGWNIGFEFPLDPGDCDRAEISDFIADHDGNIFQSGGYPGAVSYAVFKDVTDKASADRKLQQILPALDRLMSDIAAGRKIVKSAAQVAREKIRQEDAWTCDPATNPWYVGDDEAERQKAARRQHIDALAFALQSRILTDAEMQEVAGLGTRLFTREMVGYREEDVQRQLNEALLQQFRLRAAAHGK
jgi:hypothetical protein